MEAEWRRYDSRGDCGTLQRNVSGVGMTRDFLISIRDVRDS